MTYLGIREEDRFTRVVLLGVKIIRFPFWRECELGFLHRHQYRLTPKKDKHTPKLNVSHVLVHSLRQ